MSSLTPHLEKLIHNKNTADWLHANRQDVQHTLMQALNTDRHAIQTIPLTLEIYDELASSKYRINPDNWIRLLYETLLIAQRIQDNATQIQVWMRMGTIYARSGRVTSARTAFNIAIERAELEQKPELMLRLYVRLFELHNQDQVNLIMESQVNKAFELAEQYCNPDLMAALKQQVATAYGFRGEIEQAEHFAQAAITHWKQQEKPVKMAQTLFSLSASHRIMDNHHVALEYLDRASQIFASTDYPRQHLVINFEYAQHLFAQEDYDDAYELLKLTRREIAELPPRYASDRDYAACEFSIGHIYRHNSQLDQARDAYLTAIEHWQNCSDNYHQAISFHALSNIELADKNTEKAAHLLKNSFNLCNQLPNSPRKNALNQSLEKTQNRL